jgi:hypothetical protein
VTAIHIKDQDLVDARHSTFLDDMDMVYSDKGGHIVCVAVKSGVHVCWQCGEPFVQWDNKLGEVEKRVAGATVPIYVHRRCFNGYHRKSFAFVMKGLQTRRAVADIVKKTAGIFGIGD